MEGADQLATEHQEAEAMAEQRQVTAAKATEGERLDTMQGNILHQLLEGMGNNRGIVRLLGQMKTLAINRCVDIVQYNFPHFSEYVVISNFTHEYICLTLCRMTPVAKRAERKVWH